MKEFLVYTNDGFTEDPEGDPVENCQIVDFIIADNFKECFNAIKKEADNGKYQNFDIENFIIVKIKRNK